ncbi:MaoC dehydratase-like protein [Brevibacterium sanguinis]|uniref:MaoC dehydratase-like protein n=2 Tax=Brevibacterium TaxID=1696 RepID=A0A366IER9_9MICO|nr:MULTISPECIES: MaoC/PaaZ C-terminal domain-containing protein [Brevibacterium]RBP62341.1 MaoC dehydratase-like protein [Brevibacterium sanguinis]RBP68730.1 MaoC dehydratase-like protein [Brevibacterium celere]
MIDLSTLSVGDTVVSTEIPLSRASLIDYAAASGDHNPIHWSERFATEVGLDGVIAHGMLSMALVVAPIAEWLGDPGRIVDYRTRFSAPVLVPDADAGSPATPTAALSLEATVAAVDAEAGTLRIDATVRAGESDVLSRTQIRVAR